MTTARELARKRRMEFHKKRKQILCALREKYGDQCNICKRELEVKEMTIDHIKSLKNGGTNQTRNLQILCFKCNNEKGTRKIHPKNILDMNIRKQLLTELSLNGN